MNDVALMGTFSLVITRAENAATFFVRKFRPRPLTYHKLPAASENLRISTFNYFQVGHMLNCMLLPEKEFALNFLVFVMP